MKGIDQFLSDRYYGEQALSFYFDFDVNLDPLMTWNTNMVFASIVCEDTRPANSENKSSVTVWDRRITREDIESHHLKLTNEHVEYYLTDQNMGLKR